MMNDLISRQAAIYAFDCTDELIVSGEANARNVVNYINKVVGKIENLPSAQPESCEDAVSRQRLLSDLKELVAAWKKYPVMAEQIKGVETAIGYVKTIPSVTQKPTQHWIPCSERLPIARRSVILSTKEWTGEGCYWETTEHHVIWKGYRWNATFWDDEVIAWMPLPEPYREEGEE